jgi:hypothetical protein
MGIGEGFFKYIFFVIITPVGFISMYIFGGVIITLLNTLSQLFQGNFIQAFIEYFINSALPPTSVGKIIFQSIFGTIIAGVKWFIAMILIGGKI